MPEERVQRRLAAVLAADIVGYSRLMENDDAGTRARYKALQATLIDPAIDAHGGRVVKTMGDGILIDFPSAVDAVQCAIDVQRGVATENAAEPGDERIEFRVGINVGDLIIEGDDIHGDGVNVAARLESLCEPGGILVSAAVRDYVEGKTPAQFEDLGEHDLRNMTRPVRVFRVRFEDGDTTAVSRALGDAPPPVLPDKPSIAVLPFDNMSGDPEQEHFADGMAEDIITALSRMPWFFVIARNSTFTYKGRAVDVKTVAVELGVKYVLEGSVRKAGNRLRITAQLIDATTGNHVWAERYDREITDIFEIQDEVTEAIVAAVAPEFVSSEVRMARRKNPDQLDAWECVMRGRALVWKLGREDAAEARRWFERALALAPGGEFGASDLALVHFLEFFYRWSDAPERSLAAMLETAEKAVDADDSDPLAWTILAWALLFSKRWDEARESVERARALSPNFVPALGVQGSILGLTGAHDEGIKAINEAVRLSPNDGFIPLWLLSLFWAVFATERYEDSLKIAQRGIRVAPGNPTFRRQLAAAYAMLDRMDEARAALATYLSMEPGHTVADIRKIPSSVPEDLERFVAALEMAGLPA